jgi:hypothetical protein
MKEDLAGSLSSKRNSRSWMRFGAAWHRILAEGAAGIPGFAEFLEGELRGFGPRFVHACLVLARAKTLSADDRLALMQDIMHQKRGLLLGRLCGEDPWYDAALKALGKLNSRGCKKSDYMRLGGYMRIPSTARVLAFAPYLSSRILQAIWELPDWLCLPNLLPILEDPGVVAAVRKTLGARIWDLSHDDRRALIDSLRHVTSAPELLAAASRCNLRLLSKEPFPQPPIPGDHFLVPLRSAAEMRGEAREMRNCLHKMIEEVPAGQVYFTSWKDAERATVLVIYGESALTHLEVKGKANAPVAPETIAAIRALVEEQFANAAGCENARMPRPCGPL